MSGTLFHAFSATSLERNEAESTTQGGIIIPDSSQEKPLEATVVAVGSGRADQKGNVTPLTVKKGDKVKAGDTLIIIEAMKMEHSIKATENGKVTKLMVSLNQQVDNGATLLVLDS